ncbi:MAG: hypothetical protein IPK16_05370 [Anaerolineales bacterium]|nr:hypothetical protein [Anaerolineales bacterium]
MVEKGITRIGLATVYAKAQFFAVGSQRQEYLDTYHLFGDPAMRIVLSESTEPPPTATPDPVAPTLFMPLLGAQPDP